MGYFDSKELEFSKAQAVTASAISTNVVDLGPVADNATRDLNGGRPQYVKFFISESFATATSVTFSLESDSTANLATSATVHATTAAIAIASLTAGTTLYLEIPDGQAVERYLGVRYTIGGSSATAGKVTANITQERPYGSALRLNDRVSAW